ncbi:MAG: WXG100 family type VII secretion target [Sporichthyaceae bacterium]
MIDLAIPGDLRSARYAAQDLRAVSRALGTLHEDLVGARRMAADYWVGAAAQGFQDRATEIEKTVLAQQDEVDRAVAGLDAFADTVGDARELMHSARAAAVQAGLGIVPAADAVLDAGLPDELAASIADPDQAPPVSGPALAPDPTRSGRLAAAYARCEETAVTARNLEGNAHAALLGIVNGLAPTPLLEYWLRKSGFLPPTGLGTGGYSLYGTGLGILGVGAATEWATRMKYGTFAPLGPGGRVMSPQGMSKTQKGIHAWSNDSWRAKANKSDIRNRWLRGGKFLGPAGGFVNGGIAGLDQWALDSDDPTLSTSERVGRAGAHVVIVGTAAWGGAALGAQGGAAIGLAFGGPPGAVVGAIGGGLIMGVAASEAGGAIADLTASTFGKGIELATDVVSDVGGALKFWERG